MRWASRAGRSIASLNRTPDKPLDPLRRRDRHERRHQTRHMSPWPRSSPTSSFAARTCACRLLAHDSELDEVGAVEVVAQLVDPETESLQRRKRAVTSRGKRSRDPEANGDPSAAFSAPATKCGAQFLWLITPSATAMGAGWLFAALPSRAFGGRFLVVRVI